MKRIFLLLFALCVLPVAAQAQRRGTDLNASIAECKGLIPITRANTAATGAWCSLVGYQSAIVVAQSGLMDAAAQYLVMQDSTVGSAVALKDSVDVGPDSTTTTIVYNGGARFLRVVLRASGNAADSSWASAVIIRGDCRSKPC